MQYDITLRIDYDYTHPTDRTRNLLRILPRDIPGLQTLGNWTLALTPTPSEKTGFTDFFGNAVTSAMWDYPIEEVKIALSVQVERLSTAPLLSLATPLDRLDRELDASRDVSAQSPLHFTAPSRRAPQIKEIATFARDLMQPGITAAEAVQIIGSAIHDTMTYSEEATTVDTPTAEAFAKRAGVCQDFSHIMITCLRSLGIPAGYVSGFLRTFPPPGKEKLVGVDAMHAWVSAWVGPEIGWIEFDPTNDQAVNSDYITIGYGRDYDDVAPVVGAMRGAGDQTSDQSVDVAVIE
ncbi:transglutaminase domain-containing protein [Pseudooceanicola sp. MF1-13]|uniref:transglutaminase family protein n=1 Tax=Pseudooceanicola sp. MF1-13 TaxID=3379095 RepID=UPI0038912E4E